MVNVIIIGLTSNSFSFSSVINQQFLFQDQKREYKFFLTVILLVSITFFY